MASPEQISAWSSIGTMIGMVIVAVRTEMRGKRTKVAHEKTQEAIKKVEILVDGPLRVSLRATASALNHVAQLTGDNGDILAAMEATQKIIEHDKQNTVLEDFKKNRQGNLNTPRNP